MAEKNDFRRKITSKIHAKKYSHFSRESKIFAEKFLSKKFCGTLRRKSFEKRTP